MIHLDTNKSPKSLFKFICELCDYKCNKKSEFTKHINTIKHKMIQNDTLNLQKSPKNICNCGKIYKYHSGLSRHKAICKKTIVTTDDNVMELLKQNQEFKELLLEQQNIILEQQKQNNELTNKILDIKTIEKTVTNNGNNNSNQTNCMNNSFNIQLFLNEQCKDALNITEFVSSLQLQLKELETFAQLGYSEALSQILIKGLKDLDIYKRPIHCSDVKREVFYVKDKDNWEKENQEKEKLTHVIKEITNKNIKQIPEWIKSHPKCKDYDHRDNDTYMQIVSNSMIGISEQETEQNINKIIKNVAKETAINKNVTHV